MATASERRSPDIQILLMTTLVVDAANINTPLAHLQRANSLIIVVRYFMSFAGIIHQMTLEIPILERTRKFGYIYWHKSLDADVERFFGRSKVAVMVFEDSVLGKKTIDWGNRRISIGWGITRSLSPSVEKFRLSLTKDGRVHVRCL